MKLATALYSPRRKAPLLAVFGSVAALSILSVPVTTYAAETTTEVASKATAAALDDNFTKAIAAYNAGDNAASSAAVSKAATSLRKGSPANTRLTVLAKEIASGNVKSDSTLKTVFAQAHSDLASYHQGAAATAVDAKDQASADAHMKSAANSLESASKWSGHELTDEGKETVGLLRKGSGTLIGAAGGAVGATGNVLGKVPNMVSRIGATIKGNNPEPQGVLAKTINAVRKGTGTVVGGVGKVGEVVTGTVTGTGEKVKDAGDKVKGKAAAPVTPEKPAAE